MGLHISNDVFLSSSTVIGSLFYYPTWMVISSSRTLIRNPGIFQKSDVLDREKLVRERGAGSRERGAGISSPIFLEF
jgi:hypothetical protein